MGCCKVQFMEQGNLNLLRYKTSSSITEPCRSRNSEFFDISIVSKDLENNSPENKALPVKASPGNLSTGISFQFGDIEAAFLASFRNSDRGSHAEVIENNTYN
mmetsp:Transcript_9325/g.13876  ORF Transcript_9325/g.13876 Transcript_9325/m.13876 type:complete len:103 (-) Transcript_9325:27-335(-)